MIEPEQHKRPKQIRRPQKRAAYGLCRAHHDVVADAGPRVTAIELKFLCREATLPRRLIEPRCFAYQRWPIRRGVRIDFDHTRVRRQIDLLQPVIEGRRISHDQHGQAQPRGRILDRHDQLDIVPGVLCRRQEYV